MQEQLLLWAPIVLMVLNIGAIALLKFNDLKHVKELLDRQGRRVDSLDDKLDTIAERISSMEGYMRGKQNEHKN